MAYPKSKEAAIPAFDPNKPFTEVKQDVPAFDPNKPFTEVKKKEPSEVGLQEPSDGGLDGTTPKTDELPTIELYQTPTGDLAEDPFTQVKKSKELSGKTKVVSKGGIGGMGMGTTETEIVPDEIAVKESQNIISDLEKKGFKKDFISGIEGMPEDAYNNPTTSKEALSNLYNTNPVRFIQLTNEAKNKYAIRDAASQKAYNESQGDEKQKSNYASSVGILKGNEYSGDEVAPPENMQQFYDIIRKKQELINQNIDNPEEKKKAQERVRQTYSQAINPTSLDFKEEYQNSGLSDRLDINQYAGLKTLELFEPEKANAIKGIIQAEITPQWNVDVQVSPDEQVRSIVTDSAVAEKMGGVISELTINQRIAKEETLRELSLLGATNEYDSVVSEQNDLKKRYQEAKTDEEKANIYAKMLLNEQRANDLQKTEAQNDLRYPITAKLKMDNLVKEIVNNRGIGVGGWMYNRYAHGVGSGVDAIESLVTSILGSEKDKTDLRMKRIGEGKQFEASIYLPESERGINSPVTIQVTDELKKKAKDILNGRNLSELSPDERNQLSQLVANNQDQIKTITNPEAGKSKNFWSKATGMTIAGFTADIGSFLTKMGMLQGVGISAKAAEATTLFMDGYEPAFNKKLSEGASADAANEYGILHGAVLSLMAKFGSKYETIMNVVKGGKSPISKYIAGLSEESWNKLASESKPFLSKVGTTIKDIGKEQGKMIGTFGVLAPTTASLADNLFYDEGKTVSQMYEEVGTGVKEMAIGGIGFALFGAAKGIMKIKATPVEKAALFEMADLPELGKARIDELVKSGEITKEEGETKKAIIDNVSKLVQQIPEVNDKGKPLNDQQRANYLFNLAVKESQKEKAKTLPEKQAEEAKQKAIVADKENQIELEALTGNQLNDRKDKLGKAISKVDEKGKPELSDKEMADAKAELEAVNNIIKSKGDTTKTEEKLPKLSEPIEGVDEFGVPIGENVPPEVKGEPEQITQPIELSVEPSGEVKPLTKEAEDLLASIGEGSKPTFITKNLERIAKENGIEVTDKMSADDVINALKEKQSQPTPQTGKGEGDWSRDVENVDLSKVDWKNPTTEESIAGHENHINNNVKKGQQSLLPQIRELAKKYNLTKEQYLKVLPSIRQVLSNAEPNINSIENIISRESGKSQPTLQTGKGDGGVKKQIEVFGVPNKDVEPVHNVITQVFDGLKKAGLTAAKTVGEWVGIGKGEAKPYTLKINGEEKTVKPVNSEVVNGFYSPLEKTINETKFDKLPAKQWIDKFAKGEEAKWTGLSDWLAQQQGSVSKADIQKYLKDNRIQVVEVVKGEDMPNYKLEIEPPTELGADRMDLLGDLGKAGNLDNPRFRDYLNKKYGKNGNKIYDWLVENATVEGTYSKDTKFSEYQLAGEKENYKEVLVTMPSRVRFADKWAFYKSKGYSKEAFDVLDDAKKQDLFIEFKAEDKRQRESSVADFKSSHFDEPNILVHLRMNTRKDSQGNKVLFLEEIQSDWGQKGKKEGFDFGRKKELEAQRKALREDNEYRKLQKQYLDPIAQEKYGEPYGRLTHNKQMEVDFEYFQKDKPLLDRIEKAQKKLIADLNNIDNEIAKLDSKENIPTAPFVTDTNSWTKLGLKVALKEAVKQGADKIAWSTGTQQFDRWGSEKISWKKEVSEKYPDRVRWKIDLKEQESGNAFDGINIDEKALSESNVSVSTKEQLREVLNRNLKRERNDAEIDKLTGRIWDRMQKEDSGTSLPRKEGMESFYGKPDEGKLGIVGNVAKSLFKQEPKTVSIEGKKNLKNEERIKYLQHFVDELPQLEKTVFENKLSFTEQELDNAIENGSITNESYKQGIRQLKKYEESVAKYNEYKERLDEYNKLKFGTTQHSIDITPELKASVEGGQPLFKDAEAQYRIESGKNIVEAIKDFNGSPRATVALTHEIMHPTVVSIIDGVKEGNEVGAKHTKTIIDEYNKATGKNITQEQLIEGNDKFKEGTTTKEYRAVQEFIAKAWERYHREGGKGFSEGFQKVLEQITQAFKAVYKSLTGKELTPELRKMFDDILGKEAEQILQTGKGETKISNEPITKSKTEINEKQFIEQGQNKSNEVGIKPLDEKTITKKFNEIDHEAITDPYDRVLSYFGGDGKINPASINEIFGGKDSRIRQSTSTENERRVRISLIKKDAPSIDKLAHILWERDKTDKYTTQDYKDAIENVLLNYNSKSAMMKDLVEKYDLDAAYQKYLSQHGEEFSNIYDKLTEDEINHLLQMEAEKKSEEEISNYIDSLNEPITEQVTKPIPEVTPTTQQQGIKEAVPEGTIETGRAEPEGTAAVLEGERKKGITHSAIEEFRKIIGEPEYEGRPTETHEQLIKEAQETISKDKSAALKVIEKMESQGEVSNKDNAIAAVYKATLDAEIERNPTKELLKQATRLAKALDVSGTKLGKALESRKLIGEEDNLANFLMQKEAAQGTELTENQIKEQSAKYNELKEAKEALEKQLEAEREQHKKDIAELGLNKAKAKARREAKKTDAEYKAERKSAVEAAREALKQIRENPQASAAPLFRELVAIAPHVKEYLNSLASQGIDKLDNIISEIHAEFKDVLEGLTTKNVLDILAGEYDEKKTGLTKNETAATVRLLQREAKLIKELADAKKGLEKAKTEEKVIESNRRIDELKEKIKEVKRLNKEGTEKEPVEDLSAGSNEDVAKYEEKLLRKIDKLNKDLKEGNYLKEPEKEPIFKKTRKAQILEDRVIDLENKIRHERSKDEYNKRSKWRKGFDKVMEVLGVRRLVQSALDISVPFRQGATMLSPRKIDVWAKGFRANLQSIFNPKKFERIMHEIRNDPMYHEMKKDNVVFNDMGSADPNLHNEDFRKSFIYKIPILSEPLKASNRSADAFLNVARYEMYKKLRANLEKKGFTREADPKAFKYIGNWVMSMTGRGKMHSALEKPAMNAVLGNTFYGARLMASRLNLLNPVTYFDPRIPKEVRYEAMKDMAAFTSTMMTVATALAYTTGAKISLNPDDSDFLQLRYGNKVYDISGGLANYVRTGLRIMKAGYTKATGTKYEGRESTKKAGESVVNFFRNKLSPNTSYAVDAFFGGRYGKDFDPSDIYKIYPMYTDDFMKAWKEEGGALATSTVLLPNILGIGYGSYASKGQIDATMEDLLKRNLRSDEMNSEKIINYNDGGRPVTNDEFEKFADKRDAEIEKDIKVLFENGVGSKPYKELTKEQVADEIKYIKANATREVKEELFGKDKLTGAEKRGKEKLDKEREKKYKNN